MKKDVSSRRNFLKLATAGTCGALIHRAVTPYESMLAYANPQLNNNLPVLIVVNFSGGASYNVAPIYNQAYRDKNPTISFGPEAASTANNNPQGSHVLSAEQGLHPALTGLKGIWDEGNLALINRVGYPNPNRSHDESTEIWHRGARQTLFGSGSATAGWGGRLTCQMGATYSGFSLAGSNTLISGGCNPSRTYSNIANLGDTYIKDTDISGYWANMMRRNAKNAQDLQDAGSTYSRNLVTNGINAAEASINTLKAETAQALPVTFPNTGFGRSCEQAAKLIRAASLRVQFIYLQIGGFDTHSNERMNLTNRLLEVNGGLTALADALKHPDVNRWQDVTVITMSEFCRTFENGSQGTDHGHAAPMLVFGGSVKGGIKSPTPSDSLIASANGYLHGYDVDFREPFFNAVAHMGLDANAVFTEQFNTKNLDLFL